MSVWGGFESAMTGGLLYSNASCDAGACTLTLLPRRAPYESLVRIFDWMVSRQSYKCCLGGLPQYLVNTEDPFVFTIIRPIVAIYCSHLAIVQSSPFCSNECLRIAARLPDPSQA